MCSLCTSIDKQLTLVHRTYTHTYRHKNAISHDNFNLSTPHIPFTISLFILGFCFFSSAQDKVLYKKLGRAAEFGQPKSFVLFFAFLPTSFRSCTLFVEEARIRVNKFASKGFLSSFVLV